MEDRICQLIKNKRKSKGLTQRQLGELMGYEDKVAERMVQAWEYGERPVPIEKLRLLAKVLDLTLDDLIP